MDNGTRSRWITVAALIPVVGISALLTLVSVTRVRRFSVDSMVYVSAARNWLSGRGVSTGALYYPAPRYPTAFDLPQPLTNQPPLYPVAIGLLSSLGIRIADAALMLPTLAYGGILCACFFLLRRLDSDRAALLGLSLLLMCVPLRHVAMVAWSEAPGLLLAVVSLLCVCGVADGVSVAAVGGLLGGLAFATRYLYAATLPAALLACVDRRDRRAGLWRAVAYSMGFLVPGTLVVARNLRLTGLLSGPPRAPSPVSLGQHFVDFGRLLSFQIVTSPGGRMVAVLWLAALCVAVAIAASRGRAGELLTGDRRIFWIWPAFYLGLLLALALFHDYDRVNLRLVAPAAVFVLCVVAMLAARVLPVPAPIALALLWIIAAWTCAPLLRQMAQTPPQNDRKWVRTSPRLLWIERHTGVEDLIVGDRAHDVAFHFDRRVVSLGAMTPNQALDDRALCALLHDMRCVRYRNVYLVLRLDDPTPAHERLGAFLGAAVEDPAFTHPSLTPLARLDDAVVYTWRCGPSC